jgi:predicted dehydrogenase
VVCDRQVDRAEALAVELTSQGAPPATCSDHRRMLETYKLDVVSVCTSDHQHVDVVVDAAQAGVRGICCEKPIATTLEDADRMISAVSAAGVAMNIEHSRRYWPGFRKARQMLADGVIGPPARIIATLSGPRAMLFRNGTHTIDMMCFLVGGMPRWVLAHLEDGFEHYDRYGGDGGHAESTEPDLVGYVVFDHGVRAIFNGVKNGPLGSSWEVFGPTGRLYVTDRRLAICREWFEPEDQVDQECFDTAYACQAATAELIDMIEHGTESVSPPGEARKTLQIMLAFLQSQARGCARVDIP